MDLIEEHKFEKFHVDTTAWLTFKGVVMARAQAESLYKASRETLKKVKNPKFQRPNENKIEQWKHYVETFKLIDESVNHELDIAVWREAIELDASKDASARNELDKLAEALKKHKAEKAAKKKLYDAAVKRYNTASTKLKEAKAAVAKLLKAKKDLESKIEEQEELYKDAKKKQGASEQDLELYENELKKLILQRERKPVGAMKPGYEVYYWSAFKHGIF